MVKWTYGWQCQFCIVRANLGSLPWMYIQLLCILNHTEQIKSMIKKTGLSPWYSDHPYYYSTVSVYPTNPQPLSLQEYLEFKQWQESKKEEPAMVSKPGTFFNHASYIKKLFLLNHTDQGQSIVCRSQFQCFQSTISHSTKAYQLKKTKADLVSFLDKSHY